MIEHTEPIHVNAPVDTVWAFLSDPANHVYWREDVVESELVKGQPASPGAEYRQVMKPGRREMVGTHRIVDVEPGKRVHWRAMEDSRVLHFAGWFGVEPADDGGSVVTLHTQVYPRRLFKLGQPFMRGYLRKLSRQYAAGIKRAIESSAAEPT
jgi:carbon monoxide dehydrogenase subunit G